MHASDKQFILGDGITDKNTPHTSHSYSFLSIFMVNFPYPQFFFYHSSSFSKFLVLQCRLQISFKCDPPFLLHAHQQIHQGISIFNVNVCCHCVLPLIKFVDQFIYLYPIIYLSCVWGMLSVYHDSFNVLFCSSFLFIFVEEVIENNTLS